MALPLETGQPSNDVPVLLGLSDVRLETLTAGWEGLADLRHDPVLHATPVLVCLADLSALHPPRPHDRPA